MASFLYYFPYSYRSLTLLKALAKSNVNLLAIAFKSEKERQLWLSQGRKEAIKKEAKNFLYFGCSNNIFADCTNIFLLHEILTFTNHCKGNTYIANKRVKTTDYLHASYLIKNNLNPYQYDRERRQYPYRLWVFGVNSQRLFCSQNLY